MIFDDEELILDWIGTLCWERCVIWKGELEDFRIR